MDLLFWRGRWEAVPEADYVAAQRTLLAEPAWIIEGYIDPALAERARAADLIVYLDFSGPRCAWRVLKRWWRHRRVARPELPPEALERLDLRSLWVALTRAERPAIEAGLAGVEASRVRRVRTPAELRLFMQLWATTSG
jgi:adenylate kinase family enzyme